MNFTEAVKEMQKGKKAIMGGRKYKIYKDTLSIYENGYWTNIVFHIYLLNNDWEIVDDDKDWNLAKQEELAFGGTKFGAKWNDDVKKCRDLILEDLRQYDLIDSKCGLSKTAIAYVLKELESVKEDETN